ncbi:hypothetical protein DFJ74DRAFT_692029 [Hyaloraphidium curvatum]|nr:hypothetical protein DFJ74DRAFT_692029 [Hyaloraphidium curvatum]
MRRGRDLRVFLPRRSRGPRRLRHLPCLRSRRSLPPLRQQRVHVPLAELQPLRVRCGIPSVRHCLGPRLSRRHPLGNGRVLAGLDIVDRRLGALLRRHYPRPSFRFLLRHGRKALRHREPAGVPDGRRAGVEVQHEHRRSRRGRRRYLHHSQPRQGQLGRLLRRPKHPVLAAAGRVPVTILRVGRWARPACAGHGAASAYTISVGVFGGCKTLWPIAVGDRPCMNGINMRPSPGPLEASPAGVRGDACPSRRYRRCTATEARSARGSSSTASRSVVSQHRLRQPRYPSTPHPAQVGSTCHSAVLIREARQSRVPRSRTSSRRFRVREVTVAACDGVARRVGCSWPTPTSAGPRRRPGRGVRLLPRSGWKRPWRRQVLGLCRPMGRLPIGSGLSE